MTEITGECHPACLLLPEMTETEYRDLVEDIRVNGLRNQIVVDDSGVILDGRHRWRACQELGKTTWGALPIWRVWSGKTESEKVALVMSENIHRRHLTTQQRAAIAAELATMKSGARTDLASVEMNGQLRSWHVPVSGHFRSGPRADPAHGNKKMTAPARRPTPGLRGWCQVFGPLLAILWLAVMTSGCSAAPPSQRSLIFDPSAARPGSFFALLEEKILTDQVATAATDAFGGADGYERARQESRGMSSDALAREYVAGFDGYLTGLIALRFMKQLNLPPDAAKHVFHWPDGSTDVVPLPRALPLSLGSMRIAAEILRGRQPPVQIARTYMASVEGDCPFVADGIQLAQRGFLVEGVRNGRLLLAGAVGETQATFLALEARYATVTTPEEGPLDIDAPDRPSELYQAVLGTPRLTLNGLTFKSCTIVLIPARGAAAHAEEIIERVMLSNGKTYEVNTEGGMPIPFKDEKIELQQLGPVFSESPAEHKWSLQAQLHQKGNFLVTVTTPMDSSIVERFECVGPGQIVEFLFQGDRYPEMWRWVLTPGTSWIPFELTFEDKLSGKKFSMVQWTKFDHDIKATAQRYWDRRANE